MSLSVSMIFDSLCPLSCTTTHASGGGSAWPHIESYVKYPEVAYDLFQQGYDVIVLDHRRQGRSGRLLEDGNRGHVIKFDDYVEDFYADSATRNNQ